MSSFDDQRFPIGPYQRPGEITPALLDAWIRSIHDFPVRLREVLAKLADSQLDTPYRQGGWTVRQLVHHLADSHLNAYTRFKLGMTEVAPAIKPYNQDAWAQLPDSYLPVEVSLQLISALHERWVTLLREVTDWQRLVYHPEQRKLLSLADLLGQYAWHGEHHLAQIMQLIARERAAGLID
jgi:uncharacterized damage-inducible protein DinB